MSLRVFQVGNIYGAHLARLKCRLDSLEQFEAVHKTILNDIPQTLLLAPAIEGSSEYFLCFPQYERGLRLWAREQGMPEKVSSEDILLAQIEHHRSEVFYTINASRHSKAFLQRMPGSVRLKVAWLGSRIVGDAFPLFDAIVSNFPSLNAIHSAQGLNTHYLAPSYETQTDCFFDESATRPIDIFFAGTYSRHHRNRARLIESVAKWALFRNVETRFHLLNSRYTTLAEWTPLGWIPPFRDVRRPQSVRRVARPPIFGAEMFRQLCSTKVVINMAIDIAGQDRGNMRCFEAVSAGVTMISDDGVFPEGFESGVTHLVYKDIEGALVHLEACMASPEKYQVLGQTGARMLRERYSKAKQWTEFVALCDRLYGSLC
ncbi:glycosyltransferase family protein [Halomonas sp. LBP4]|uniref:glycosyltransferase family protein n=1 Tax=Halomonas sp. LBP4 TaxID=2044917 RepID=UPI000D75F05F|nr:glycosyltransferase [Halomonas sp. LBP4]PXX97661.1 hypothetical protein CR157_13275 [Halomonas sp. LBP4]